MGKYMPISNRTGILFKHINFHYFLLCSHIRTGWNLGPTYDDYWKLNFLISFAICSHGTHFCKFYGNRPNKTKFYESPLKISVSDNNDIYTCELYRRLRLWWSSICWFATWLDITTRDHYYFSSGSDISFYYKLGLFSHFVKNTQIRWKNRK